MRRVGTRTPSAMPIPMLVPVPRPLEPVVCDPSDGCVPAAAPDVGPAVELGPELKFELELELGLAVRLTKSRLLRRTMTACAFIAKPNVHVVSVELGSPAVV